MRRGATNRGSAAAQCGEASPHRREIEEKEAAPPCVEAKHRRGKIRWARSVSHRLTALGGGKAANTLHRIERKLTTCATIRLLTAHRSLLTVLLLLSAYCLLPPEWTPSLTVGLLPRAFSQNQPAPAQLQPSPSPSPAPSPSPSPTPPPNLHQWGAVTSFHGLPSDRTHAIAQTEFGVTWFATDGGLARYDGRRTNAINAEGLPPGRVLTLKSDETGALWIGTDNGAARLANAKFVTVKETVGKVITTIITPQPGRAIMASEAGQIFDCQVKQPAALSETNRSSEGDQTPSFSVRTIPDQPLQSADKDRPGPLKITSLALLGDKLYAGTQSRGLIVIENGEAREVTSKPRSYFINALAVDSHGHLWTGARARVEEGGLFDNRDPLKPAKANASTGPVTAIARGTRDDIWVATDGHGAFHFEDGKPIEHFTFEGTGGALRSDHLWGVFVDPEEVVWFATDKGVCRYDPHAMRTESISDDSSANYVRALFRTSRGLLLAGTNSGLYLNNSATKKWQALPEIGRRIVFTIAEDKSGRVLVATANGLFASTSNTSDPAFTRLTSPVEKLAQGDSVRAIANFKGATYIATYAYGVERIQGSQRQLVWPDSAADNHLREITSLGQDYPGDASAERLLIGTAGAGVFVFDGKESRTESVLDKLKGGAVWTIVEYGQGSLLGTDKGLFLFQAGQLKDIVPGVIARQVVTTLNDNHANRAWCATSGNGLQAVVIDDQFGAIVSRLDVEQGLPSQRVFAVLSERNADGSESVIAGTNRGLVRYDPGYVTPTVLPARIISQRIHEQSELRSGLKLDYPQNSLLLDVTAISSRTFPEQFQYAFALSDSSGKVIREKLSHDSQFAMEKLKAGTYKVVARAFTKDLTQAVPLSFEFTVARAPFPWTSTALGVLLLFALIALGWGYFQNRRIHRTSAALASANRDLAEARLQLANETEAERRRIARDLHDQTLADLRNLALLVDRLPSPRSSGTRAASEESAAQVPRPNRAPSAPSALRVEIESISHEVRRICEDLSPSALENVGLSAALQFALAHAVEHAAPDCKFDYEFVCDDGLDEKLNLPASVQIQIYRVTQEALSNICRHANAKHVKMSVTVSERSAFDLQIEDDGRGFDRSGTKKKPGRGVANIRARASMIDAEVEWSKREGGGTVFVLRKEGAAASPLPVDPAS
jgi:signal transduction histidine kinase/ligand-binding sensor domain-containing protein